MKKRMFLVATIAVATLAACSGNDENEVIKSPATFKASIEGVATRMYDTTWEGTEEIGVSATDYSNKKYTISDASTGTMSGTETYYYQTNSTDVTFTAYYPYAASDGSITVSTAADNQTTDNQKTIDYLWAQKSGNAKAPAVEFTFAHKMSQLKLVFKADADSGISDLTKLTAYTLTGLKLDGTFSTADGTASASGSAADLAISLSDVSGETYTSTLILLPQTISSIGIKVTYNGQNYEATLNVPSNLVAGQGLQYNVTLSNTAMSVSKATITAWDYSQDGNSGNGIDSAATMPQD